MRALEEVRDMFRRLLGDRAPDRLRPPPPRKPAPDDFQAVDRAVLLQQRIGWLAADGQSNVGSRTNA
eukprot:2575127-Pyramimonas_sp.AAC.1